MGHSLKAAEACNHVVALDTAGLARQRQETAGF